MTGAGDLPPSISDPITDAATVARLCAIDPGLGGMILRGGGEVRDAVVAMLLEALGDVPVRRLPVHIDDERLLGGIDLGATLAAGRAVRQSGLLAEAAGGVVVMPMAERMSDATAARIASAIDGGARFVTVALDNGLEPDERVPAALAERVAFLVDLSDVRQVGIARDSGVPRSAGREEGRRPEQVRHDDGVLSAIVATAGVFGIESARPPLLALRAARASAAFAGRDTVEEEDVALAARLVLAPRATRLPALEQPEEENGSAVPATAFG